MATKPLSADNRAIVLPNAMPVPPAAVTRLLARYSRGELAGFIAVAIDLLDLADGDHDTEANGDELDGCGSEDCFGAVLSAQGGPGCPLSDPGEEDDPSGQCDEDGINTLLEMSLCLHGTSYGGPGCPISDPDRDEYE